MHKFETTPIIHRNLKARELWPKQHIADPVYVNGPIIVSSQVDFGVELISFQKLGCQLIEVVLK